MIRLLILLGIIFLIVWAIDKLGAIEKIPRKLKHKKMVKCEYCQVYIPRDESLESKNLFFCCKEHQDVYMNK